LRIITLRNTIRKIKIVFDSSVLVSGNVSGDIHRTGLYRFSYEVLSELVKSADHKIYLFDVFQRERELKKYIQKEFNQCERIHVYGLLFRILIFPIGNLSDRLREIQLSNNANMIGIFSGLAKNGLLLFERGARYIERKFFISARIKRSFRKCDIYYSTYYPLPLEVRNNVKIKKVYTVHDMIPILHPEYFSSSFNEKLLKEVVDNIRTGDFVISVSESTKRDILNYRCDLKEEQIIVTHLAASDKFYRVEDVFKIERIKCKYKINFEKYILSVCTIEPRKNLTSLIQAFKNIIEKEPDINLNLVLIGSYGWNSGELIKEIEEINLNYQKRIILTGFVPDEDLASLYSGALMFVYPSIYEGFGLPVLEAMQCGLPVITSDKSSLPEVIGDSGILIDPTDIIALETAIWNVYKNPDLARNLREKAMQRVLRFNWQNTSRKILEIMNSIII
jgi:glycosyltransferase involved in cell wall biosynthesis